MMPNTGRTFAYTIFVALVGATFAACGGGSGGVDGGKDAADAAATDVATEHGDAQSNDSLPSDVASTGDAGSDAGAGDVSGDASTDGSADASSDVSADASSDVAADASVDVSADASNDGSSDVSADASDDTSSDAAGDASAADAGADALTCGATDTPDNCGACGNICPGYQKPNDNVTCAGGAACTFSCQGEHYDVDGQLANGCEATDVPSGNHTQPTAAYGGSFPCTDASSNPNIHGTLISDARMHANPAIGGFDDLSGSAPDWTLLTASGGAFCSDDLMLTLQVTGSSRPDCYKLTVITNKVTLSAPTSAGGTAVISQGAAYSDNTTIYVTVSKTCSLALTENVSYSVTGHL